MLVEPAMVEGKALEALGDANVWMRLAAARALMVMDAKKYQGKVAEVLSKVLRPLDAALAAREVYSLGVETGAKEHLEACHVAWPLASRLFLKR